MFNKRTSNIIGHSLSLYSILFLYYNSIIVTHFLLSLLFYIDNNDNDNDNENENDNDDKKEEEEEEVER